MIITCLSSSSGGKEKPPFGLGKTGNNHSSFLSYYSLSCECVLIYLRDVQNTRRKENDSCFGARARNLKHDSHIKRGVNTYSISVIVRRSTR